MPRPVDLEELVRLPEFYHPLLDESRSRVAFYWDRSGRIELYTMDVAEGATPVQASRGEVPRSPRAGFSWSRDGGAIIFARDRDGDEQHQLYSLDLESGGLTQLTSAPGQHHPGRVSPDGREMLLASNRIGQMNAYALDLRTHDVRALTAFPAPTEPADWSPDGRFIYLTGSESPDPRNEDIYRVRRDGSDLGRIFSSGEGNSDQAGRVSPDGRHLAVTSNQSGYHQPGMLDLETLEVRWVGGGGTDEYAGPWSPDGRKLLTFELAGTRSRLFSVDTATGRRTQISTPAGVVWQPEWLDGERIMAAHADTTHRTRLVVLRSDKAQVLLDADYGRLSPEDFVAAQPVQYSSDAYAIHGLLYKPARDGQTRLPAIVWVHGGPTGQDVEVFSPYVQFLCSLGFAVLEVNYRGSTGYGRPFQEANRFDIGGGDARDVAAGARFLAEDPDIDPGRILCGGGSYGGYMTYRQLTHFPELWAGGIAWVGITDWERLYEESMEHFKHYIVQLFGAAPDEAPDRYRAASPIEEAERLRAPLLIIHGQTDPRCPISQARTFRDRLVALGLREGQEFAYHELSAQGHGSADIDQKLQSFRVMETFLRPFAEGARG